MQVDIRIRLALTIVKNGVLTQPPDVREHDTLVENFGRVMATCLSAGVMVGGAISVGNTPWPYIPQNGWGSLFCGDNDGLSGIVVGTDPTPVDFSDIKLGTKVNNGTGSGELHYNTTTFITPTVSGNTVSFGIQRTFTNNGPATVVVKEIGAYMTSNINRADQYLVMLSRDTPGDQNVVPLSTLTVTWFFDVTAT